jgi:hypothetical protein
MYSPTQEDTFVRLVALENLEAMAERVSGFVHRYWIEKLTPTRVTVGYSNPDEYGRESPMYAVFPCYPSRWPEDHDNPRVVLRILRVMRDSWDGEGWQAFQLLLDCPVLWRSAEDPTKWQTEDEIKAKQATP